MTDRAHDSSRTAGATTALTGWKAQNRDSKDSESAHDGSVAARPAAPARKAKRESTPLKRQGRIEAAGETSSVTKVGMFHPGQPRVYHSLRRQSWASFSRVGASSGATSR